MTSTFKPSTIHGDKTDQSSLFVKSRLYRAIRKGDSHRVLAAINKGEDVHLQDQDTLFTYLHLVVTMASSSTQDRFLPMVYILSNYDIEVNAHDKRGRTALELAINKELHHIMVALIRVGTDLSDKDYKAMIQSLQSPFQPELFDTFEKYEPGLWVVVKKNDAGMVHMLINSWCRISTNKNNKSLINYAKLTRKSPEIIQILEEFDATMEFVHATLAGDERRMLQYLMDPRGTDPYIMDISYQESWSDPLIPRSLRDTAEAMGHNHILHVIPEAQNDSSEEDSSFPFTFDAHMDEDTESTATNSEYAESIPNSLEGRTSMTSNLRKLQRAKSHPSNGYQNDLTTSDHAIKVPAESYVDPTYYHCHPLDDDRFQFDPEAMLKSRSSNSRFSWDSRYSLRSKDKTKIKPKKKSIRWTTKKYQDGDYDQTKSKTCVIQ